MGTGFSENQMAFSFDLGLDNESRLAAAAFALGAASVPKLSASESALIRGEEEFCAHSAERMRRSILRRLDPLGDAFALVRTAGERRRQGATYTPLPIVRSMIEWAANFQKSAGWAEPERVVDPGAGSARFLLAAARRFPNAELIGVELDPLAALIARANLAAGGYATRSRIVVGDYRVGDYRDLKLPPAGGRTLYVGNPPYVRHHVIAAKWKQWLTAEARALGYEASQLAGLHVHFFLATALQAKAGDFGSFITAAEWMDVNYGRLVRRLFLNELGGRSLTVIEPTARPFADAASTAVIGTFEIGARPKSIHVRRVDEIAQLQTTKGGRLLHRARFETETRWSRLTRRSKAVPVGFIELGELCRVHRGQVTGANRVWIAGKHSRGLPPAVLFRSVTRARELFQADGVLGDCSTLKQVIDLPVDLSVFDADERRAIDGFLKIAKAAGAAEGYVAANRRAWWAVGLKSPAPILATYMARRAPAFVRNLVDARHINIAHGLYPREPLAPQILDRLAAYLAAATHVHDGRTYAGGLTKFEPREMERLSIPNLETLALMGP